LKSQTATNHVKALPNSAYADLLVFGASGHGRVVADAALCSGAWRSVLASDRNPARQHGELLPQVSMIAPEQVLQELHLHMAIGNNTARAREARAWGEDRLVTVCHPASIVSAQAQLAGGCFVAAQAVIAPGARLGLGVIVNHGAVVDHDCEIDGYSHIAPQACLGGGVRVGHGVLIGAGAIVLPGLQVADGVIVGAGAVVQRSITELGTYVGVPARRLI
jgi:sugar O-acyltransferase (sialic acid O-acetyltransferase NeuD family)